MDELLLNTPEGRGLIELSQKAKSPAELRESGRMSRLHGTSTNEYGRTVTQAGGVTIIDVPRRDGEMQSNEGNGDEISLLQTGPKPWGPLPGREPPGEFPIDALPERLHTIAACAADSVQVSLGMAACMALGAVSAAAAGKVSVRVKGDYVEPCQLFIAIGANPSERKSACMSLVFQALNDYDEKRNIEQAPKVKLCQETKALLEEGITRAKKAGDRKKMAELIDELNAVKEEKPYELILTDATPEALSKAMARNGGRMALVSSEGAFLNVLAGGYSTNGAANVDVVLKGYSGEPVRVERIGRGSEKIAKACLSLCLAVQPDMLETFLADPTLAGRGMASRFLACMPQSRVGGRTLSGISMSPDVMKRFALRLELFLNRPEPYEIKLDAEAYAECERWFQEIEKELKPGGELSEVGQGWGGKLCGNTVRIAGLLALMSQEPDQVDGTDMRGGHPDRQMVPRPRAAADGRGR